jgi:hypothetical protein
MMAILPSVSAQSLLSTARPASMVLRPATVGATIDASLRSKGPQAWRLRSRSSQLNQMAVRRKRRRDFRPRVVADGLTGRPDRNRPDGLTSFFVSRNSRVHERQRVDHGWKSVLGR